jgi:predicted negative regulator of RcsB-dependent stress response
MAYDLEEQEQIDILKAWWARHGNLVTWLLTAILAAYAAWAGWNYYQRSQSAHAGQLYVELQKAIETKDNAKVQRAATDMTDKFGRTAYAEMAALAAAKSAYDANDMREAKARLQWVIDKGSEEYKAIAKIRLAGILLDEKAYDEGVKLLSGEFPAQFAGVVADRKGDILVAQNKLDDARSAYRTALDKMDQKNPARQLIQVKLDAIGGSSEKAAA